MFYFVILPFWVLECVACLTGFILLIRSHVRQGKHWFGQCLLWGVMFGAAGMSVLLAIMFAGGLSSALPQLAFDRQSVMFAPLGAALLYPTICLLQFLALWSVRHFRIKLMPQLACLAPAVCAAIVIVVVGLYHAMPQQRFSSFIGIKPPDSVKDIAYSKYTAGFFTSVKLTCQIDPKDADVILKQNTSALTITFNPTNNLITATHAAD